METQATPVVRQVQGRISALRRERPVDKDPRTEVKKSGRPRWLAQTHLRIEHGCHEMKSQIPVLEVEPAIIRRTAGLTTEPSPHGTHGGKTPTGTPAGRQQAALRLQPDCFVAVLGTTLLGPELAGALRDLLVGHGVRSVGRGGGVCVLRVAVVVFHGGAGLNDGPTDRFSGM